MAIRDTNLYPTIAAARQTGMQNALLEQNIGDQAQTRNLIAEMTMPGASSEEKQQALNALLAIDPAQAGQVLGVQDQAHQIDLAREIEEARRGIGMAEFVSASSDPVTALQLLDEDSAIREVASELGVDTENPDEVRQLMDMLKSEYNAVIGMVSERNSLQEKLDTVSSNLGRELSDEEVLNLAGGGGAVEVNIGEKLNEPIPITQLANLRDAEGNAPPIGTTFADARDAGYTVTTESERSAEDKTDSAMRVLDELEGMAIGEGGVFEEVDRGFLNRAVASIEHGFDLLTQNDPGAARFNDMAAGTLAPIIKAMGESGALADGDVQRALGLIPRTFPLLDTRDVAQGKFEALRRILRRGAANTNALEQGQLPNLEPVLGDDDFSLEGAVGTSIERARELGKTATEIASLGVNEFATAISSMDLPALQSIDLDALGLDQLEALQDRLDALGF